MPETRQPIHVANQPLDELAKAINAQKLPPVERWNPKHCGHSGMRIAAGGTWFHEGAPITRPAMIRLFSTVLRREPDGSHVLVTPVERLIIDVEVTPFRAVAMSHEGAGENRRIALEIDSGDAVIVGAGHPLRMVEETPRVEVRHGLEAMLSRPLYYELAEIALAEGHEPAGVWSDGCFFPLQ